MTPFEKDLEAQVRARNGHLFFTPSGSLVTDRVSFVAWWYGSKGLTLPSIRGPDFQPYEVMCPFCYMLPDMVCEEKSAVVDVHIGRVRKAFDIECCGLCEEPIILSAVSIDGEYFCSTKCMSVWQEAHDG